jgi:pimeloyl-ACP methyl ester carboxylesterase
VLALQVSSQFIDVQGRRVLVRFAGHGPAVLLLHQSPQNSRSLIPWIERLSERYAVFAPDTPGFGASDPLPLAQPTIPDFAAALAKLIQALGLQKVVVNGVHTGAVVALRLALDFPHLVAGAICDGYARFNANERQKLLNGYLPPFEPEWNGNHLSWLWSRMREQSLYFPWNTPVAEARIAYPAPSIQKLQADVMDIIDAGDGYRAGYRAPFLYDDASAVSRLMVPSRIFYRAEDVLALHMPRLGAAPANVVVRKIEGGAAALIKATDGFIAERAGAATVLNAAAAISKVQSLHQRIVNTSAGPLSVLLNANGGSVSEAVEVCIQDIACPSRVPEDVPHGTYVVAAELPGHGTSRDLADAALTPEGYARALLVALDTIGVSRFAVRAEGASAAFAAELGRLAIRRITRMHLHNPMPLTDDERASFLAKLPDLTPHDTGAHLLAAWNWVRMKHIFVPWQPQTATYARKIDAPAPSRIHAEVREMLRCGERFAAICKHALAVNLVGTVSELRRGGVEVEVSSDEDLETARLAAILGSSP